MSIPESNSPHQSGLSLQLLVITVTVVLIGLAAYFVVLNKKPLTRAEAAIAVNKILQSQGTINASFHTGFIQDRIDESAHDPQYRFLQRAGVIQISAYGNSAADVTLTPKGSEILKQISGVQCSKETDGRELYSVPLAEVGLEEISNIRMSGSRHAVVNFSWRWRPNAMGDIFDASGVHLREFSSGERAAMIDFYGARYYQQAPTKATVSLVKAQEGWVLEK